MAATDTHNNREPKRRCQYCDWEGPGRGLTFHVLNSDDDDHGEKYDLPDDFDASEAEIVGDTDIRVNMPRQYRVGHRKRRVCRYCGKVCRGQAGLKVHLSHLQGDEVHPEGSADEDLTIHPSFKVNEDGEIVDQDDDALSIATGGAVPSAEAADGKPGADTLTALEELRDEFMQAENEYEELSPVEAAEKVQDMMKRYTQPGTVSQVGP